MRDSSPARRTRTPFARGPFLGCCAVAAALASGSTASAQGPFTHDSNAMATASDLTKSLLLSGGITAGLELAAHRTQPNGGSYSFPAARTSAAFAVAPILASRYGWKAGVPAYTLAFMTGFGSRENGNPRASSVVAGAAVGLAVGGAMAHHRSTQQMAEHVYMGKRGLGLKFGF